VGKPGVEGAYTNQRLNLSKPWEGLRMTCQGFKPDSGNPTVRHYRGASRNVRHGETVTPPAIERAGPETPHLQRGALDLYPNPSLVIRLQRSLYGTLMPCEAPSTSSRVVARPSRSDLALDGHEHSCSLADPRGARH